MVAALGAAGFEVVETVATADGAHRVAAAVLRCCDSFSGLVVTTGGTGFGPRDLTPEGTKMVLDREAPGLAEAMRGCNPLGRLSRGAAGTVGTALVLNVPGSTRGSVECLEAVLDVLPHALALMASHADRHPSGEPGGPAGGPRGTVGDIAVEVLGNGS